MWKAGNMSRLLHSNSCRIVYKKASRMSGSFLCRSTKQLSRMSLDSGVSRWENLISEWSFTEENSPCQDWLLQLLYFGTPPNFLLQFSFPFSDWKCHFYLDVVEWTGCHHLLPKWKLWRKRIIWSIFVTWTGTLVGVVSLSRWSRMFGF